MNLLQDFQIKTEHNAIWRLIFYQRANHTHFLKNYEEFLSFKSQNIYSIIGIASSFPKINGHYEFLLEYPELEGYNRWIQDVFPTNHREDYENCVPGYECKECTWKIFCGLCLNTDRTYIFLEGNSNSSWYWYYGIGSLQDYVGNQKSGIPGPFQHVVDSVLLWMRINPNISFNTQSIIIKPNIYILFNIIYLCIL